MKKHETKLPILELIEKLQQVDESHRSYINGLGEKLPWEEPEQIKENYFRRIKKYERGD